MTKPTKWVCAQRRLRPDWAESLISLRCALSWVAKDPGFLHADSKDSDQTGRMPRLIWSSLSAQPFCWFCHAAAQINVLLDRSPSVTFFVCFVRLTVVYWTHNENAMSGHQIPPTKINRSINMTRYCVCIHYNSQYFWFSCLVSSQKLFILPLVPFDKHFSHFRVIIGIIQCI